MKTVQAMNGAERVRARLEELTGARTKVSRFERLSGGACQENFLVVVSFDDDEERLVLRSDAHGSLPGSLDRATELAVIEHARREGVRTPRARWLSPNLLREGAASYFLDFVEGEAIGAKVLKSP